MKAIVDFLQKVLPELAFSSTETLVKKQPPPPPPPRSLSDGTQTEAADPVASTSKVYETPKLSF